ncbi:hypothetical protein Fmac_013169 [Flemingia macrophylla]|uniref:DUF4408 domain-containing protein n=1 Tax=Flemingia macrophylla TaxID=520843 RepID=A0ABD1MSE0_9FABA
MGDAGSLVGSWLSPCYLFILVNVVIGTIAITSRLAKDQPQLRRSPSLLQRVSSFSFTHSHTSQPDTAHSQPHLVPTPSLLERLASFNLKHEHVQPQNEAQHVQPPAQTQHVQPQNEIKQLVRSPSLLQRVQSMNLPRFYRSDSVRVEMRKSASEKAVSMEEEEEVVERRRPATATATARVETTSSRSEDEEVDAKADDFINSFRKQLRLQRIESLLRYRSGATA